MKALCCLGVFPQKSRLHAVINSIEKPFKHLLGQHEDRYAFWTDVGSNFILALFGFTGLRSPGEKQQHMKKQEFFCPFFLEQVWYLYFFGKKATFWSKLEIFTL